MSALVRKPEQEGEEGRTVQTRAVTSPSPSQISLTHADIFETDVESDDEGNFEDSSDEELEFNGEAESSSVHGRTGSLPTVSTSDSLRTMTESQKSSTSNNTATQENKFLVTLFNAPRSHPALLRVPLPLYSPLKESQVQPTHAVRYLHEVKSDESDNSDNDSDSEEFGDAELLLDRPIFDTDWQASQLFFQPSSPWAGFANAPIENPVVISKLHAGAMCDAYIKQGILGGRTITYISKTWLLSQKWEGFFSEMALYSDPNYLRPLQGGVIPKIIGLYIVEGAISVAMELPSSEFWIEASEDMSNHLKRKCIAAFDAIHEQGVLHNDVELRHMLVSSQGNVTVIDFQESRVLKPLKEVGLEAATEAEIRLEKRKVQFKLNYEDARTREEKKRIRVLAHIERKRQDRMRRTKLVPGSGSEIETTNLEDESETEDPDDVLNPIVDRQTWEDYWLEEPFTPTCYIVPGQEVLLVGAAIQELLFLELDRLDKEKAASADDCRMSLAQEEPSHSGKSSLSVTSPATVPILPMRVNLKRSRELVGDDLDDAPSPKRPQLAHIGSKIEDSKADAHLNVDSSIAAVTEPLDGTEQNVGHSVPSAISPTQIPLITKIHVPFEGYTESDGFILPNKYSTQEQGDMRKTWIRQYNIKRSIEDNLPYPLAELGDLVPSTIRKMVYYRNEKKRFWKPPRNRGTMRRAQLDKESPGKRKRDAVARRENYFRRRCEPGTGLSDSDDEGESNHDENADGDDIPEGPRISSWHGLEEDRCAGYSRSPLYSTPAPSPPPRPAGSILAKPSRGVLRKQLTPQERARNVAYLEAHKKRQPPDPELDNEADRDSDVPRRPFKRPRSNSGSSEAQTQSSSSSGAGFQKYSGTTNAFAVRSRNGGSSSFSGRSISSLSSSDLKMPVPGPSTPGPSSSDIIPRRVNHTLSPSDSPYGGDRFSVRASSSLGRFSNVASYSDSSSDGDDQGPPSPAWPPRRKRLSRRPQSVAYSGMATRLRSWTLDELDGSELFPQPERLTAEDVADMAAVEELIVAEKSIWPWADSSFRFPWRWPTFRQVRHM